MGRIKSSEIKNTVYPECCTRMYSSFNYHGANGSEYAYDAVLSGFDGGELSIVDEKGETVRTIIQKSPKNGRDVVLPSGM